jgi:hypothetical protein
MQFKCVSVDDLLKIIKILLIYSILEVVFDGLSNFFFSIFNFLSLCKILL